jgi:hypothetical protein
VNVLLTNTVLLPLAALLLVPLAVHLFARAHPPVYRFSSVEFLRRVLRRTVRIRKPQSFLVLILRTLLVGAVLAVFLKPVLFGGPRRAATGEARTAILLIDATASMAASDGSQTRFVAACAKAAEILDGLSTADQANVIWLGTPNRAEFQRPGPNVAFLKSVLRTASVTAEATDVSAAFAQAVDMLRDRSGAGEVYVLSDFQSSVWQSLELPPLPDIEVLAVKIGQTDLANLAITAVSVDPTRPLPGEETTVQCEVNHFSPEHSLATLLLRAGESLQTQDIRLSPWQRTSVNFRVRFETPGEKVISALLTEDLFPYDNERWAIVDVVHRVKVGIIGDDLETMGAWRRVCQALDWVDVVELAASDFQRELDFDVLLLAGWRGGPEVMQAIQRYIERRGLVVWWPAQETTENDLRVLAGVASGLPRSTGSLEGGQRLRWDTLDRPLHLAITDRGNPLFEVFAGGLYGDPTRAAFTSRYDQPAQTLSSGTTLLVFEDGVPALALFEGAGKLAWWNLPLSRAHSDLALQPEFVSLFGELLRQHRRREGLLRPSEFVVGQLPFQEFREELLDGDVRVETAGRALKVLRRSTGGTTMFTTEEARLPGICQWFFRGRPLNRQAVNFPSVESDLRTQATIPLGGRSVPIFPGQRSIAELREGTPLWPYFLALAAVMVLGEGLALVWTEKP